jgi:hypothetical protein
MRLSPSGSPSKGASLNSWSLRMRKHAAQRGRCGGQFVSLTVNFGRFTPSDALRETPQDGLFFLHGAQVLSQGQIGHLFLRGGQVPQRDGIPVWQR